MNAEVAAATLCNLEKQLTLLNALLTTTLLAVIITFAAAGCKSLQEKTKRSIRNPAQESNKNKGEMVLCISTSSTSCHAEQLDIAYPSRELINFATCTTTTPVQRASTDKGQLVLF